MPDESPAHSTFVVSLCGSDAPSARSVVGVIHYTDHAILRLAEIVTPEFSVRTKVIGIERGSLLLVFGIVALDGLARISPTTHAFLCMVLYDVGKEMLRRLGGKAKSPLPAPTTTDERTKQLVKEAVEAALSDRKFKATMASIFEAAMGDEATKTVGLSRTQQEKPISLPVGYFHDPDTGLALPEGYFEKRETIKIPQASIFVDRGPHGAGTSWRTVHWMYDGKLVSAPGLISNDEILAQADTGEMTPISAVELEIEQIVNKVNRRVRPVKVIVSKVLATPKKQLGSQFLFKSGDG
jgi:hypothetical protein